MAKKKSPKHNAVLCHRIVAEAVDKAKEEGLCEICFMETFAATTMASYILAIEAHGHPPEAVIDGVNGAIDTAFAAVNLFNNPIDKGTMH